MIYFANRSQYYRCALLVTAASFSVIAPSAMAQDGGASDGSNANGPQVAEIVVTAQKRAENLQNVPIAVSVVQADALAAAGVDEVRDLAAVTPGLMITESGSNFILPRIRGVGSAGSNMSLENPVAIYVDNVYYASTAGSMFSLNNISQVSVLKGPQGTLFGRNATGGVIQVTTLDPSTEFGGKIEATIGNKMTYGGSLYLTGGLASNVAADIAVYYNRQEHGFGRNLDTGQYVNDAHDFAARSKIKADLGDTTITLSGDYMWSRMAEPVFRPLYGTLPINKIPFTGGKWDIDSDTQPLARTEQWGGSLTIEHQFDGVRFTSITAYRSVEDQTILDNDGLPAPTTVFLPDAQVVAAATGNERQFTQEFQLASDNDGPLTWTLGFYYFSLKGFYDPPVRLLQLGGAIDITLNSTIRNKAYAGFGQATYAISDNFNVTGGLRYTHENRKASGTSEVIIFGGAFPTEVSSGTYKKGQFTWRLAADYRPSEEVLAYVSYNRGFKSGGFNPTEIPYDSFDPEKIDAYEAGLKLDLFDRRLRVNPAVFYYDYSNLQALVYGIAPLPVTRNAAAAEIYGMDLDFTAAVSEQFTLSGGLSILHARYKTYNDTQIATPDLVNGGNILTIDDVSGTRLINTPDWTANLGADYRVPVGDNELSFHVNYSYNDGFYADADNRLRQDAYHLVDASVRFETGAGYYLKVWGKNIGNVAYATQLYATLASDKIRMAPGRTFGVSAGAKF